MAHGSISFVRTRHIPMVSSLAAAISDVGLDAADHYLDCQHLPDLLHVAFAHTWGSVGGASWLGNAAGIRMRGNSCRNSRFAQEHRIEYALAKGARRAKATALQVISVSRNICLSSNTTFRLLH